MTDTTAEDIIDYIMRHRPKRAYLGKEEMRAMIREAEKSCHYPCSPQHNEANRLEYCGCPLFEVNADSHVGYIQ